MLGTGGRGVEKWGALSKDQDPPPTQELCWFPHTASAVQDVIPGRRGGCPTLPHARVTQ